MHLASTPNIARPEGGMTHDKMLSFVTGMTKHGLQHFADGGTTLSAPTGPSNDPRTTSGGFTENLGNFLGTNNNFQAQGAPIQQGTNTAQLNSAYTGAQSALGTQAGLTSTLGAGLNQGVGSQNNLTNMYTAQANGQGPNPALAQLNQATGQNISQQAALMAGQRGAGANAGLLATQAAQQGAATQQNAVGQAATLQAQQQLAAEQNLQNLAANQIAQGTSATQGLNSAAQNEQNILQGANTAGNNANVSQQGNINNVNAGISTANQSNAGNIVSGIGNAVSSVAGAIFGFAKGGSVPMPRMMADGGVMGMPTNGPQSYVGQWLNSSVDTQGPMIAPGSNLNTNIASPFNISTPNINFGASTTQAGAPIPGSQASDYTSLSDLRGSNPGDYKNLPEYKGGLMKKGGKVRAEGTGEKASASGDSLSNDKIPAMLSEGEIVIPRHITMSDRAPEKAAAFVAAQLAKRGRK